MPVLIFSSKPVITVLQEVGSQSKFMIIMSCVFLEEHSIDFSVTDVFNFQEVIGHLENF